MSDQSCIGEDGKSLFQNVDDVSATILTFVSLSSCPFTSPACRNLGWKGNVSLVTEESCVGEEGKSLFQMLI